MAEFGRILYGVEDRVAAVTLNRPEKRNALDDRTVAELREAFLRAEADDAVAVVLLRGAGPDFCAGADLAQLEKIAAGAGPLENLADAEALGALLVLMRRLAKPIVAAVHGHAFAGGAGLATACDVVLAAEDARFGYPEVHLGFVPAMVMALLRRACGEKIAFELVARGDRIEADVAHRIGLVNRILPAATFDADAAEYARELAARSPSALRLVKRLFYGIDGASFEEAIARGAEVNVLARMTEDTRAGVRRFLERRAPR
ncbi:MAG TPA: enoyl-CoA hydratase-related protein [Longimicrobiales bacterium]